MGCFSNRHRYTINEVIKKLGRRMLNINGLELTHKQFLDLFCTPDEVKILRQAEVIADVSGYNRNFTGCFKHQIVTELTGGSELEIDFKLNSVSRHNAPICPRNRVIRPDADPKTIEQITSWVTHAIGTGFAFSKTRALFGWFDSNCASKSTVRYYWPTIIALASEDNDTKDLGESLLGVKPPRSAPSLPPEVRAACRETSGVIAAARLLPEEGPKAMPQVEVRLQSASAVNCGALGLLMPTI
jgi:hypothetical protein